MVMCSRHLMTQLDMTLLTCIGWLWCPCQATSLMSDGCTLGVLCIFLTWHRAVGSSIVLVLLDGSIHVFLFLVSWYAWYVRQAARKSSSMCTPSSSRLLSHHDLPVYLFLQFTHDGMTSNPKPPRLSWCIVLVLRVTGREESSLRQRRVHLRLEWGIPRGKPTLSRKNAQWPLGGRFA